MAVMWMEIHGDLRPGIKYRCIPEDEYATLKASRDKLVETLKEMVNADSFVRIMVIAKNAIKEAEL